MTTATQTHPATQSQQEQFAMSTTYANTTTFDIQHKEQSMNHPAVNFLKTSPAQDTSNGIIVHDKDGVNIEQSLRNVTTMASTWYKTSTRQLYAVLGQCYELYYLIESADSSKRDKYRDDVKATYKALNGVQGANTLLGKIVSVAFNFADLDRRQRSRYGSVIKTAYTTEHMPTDAAAFVGWLEHTGGIVAALDKRSDKASDKPEQSEINETVRALPAKARLSILNSGNKFVVLLAQPVDANTVEVLYQFEEDALGDSLATKAFNSQLKLAKDADKRDTAASAADELSAQNAAQEEA
jgi:hypothetical protein